MVQRILMLSGCERKSSEPKSTFQSPNNEPMPKEFAWTIMPGDRVRIQNITKVDTWLNGEPGIVQRPPLSELKNTWLVKIINHRRSMELPQENFILDTCSRKKKDMARREKARREKYVKKKKKNYKSNSCYRFPPRRRRRLIE